MYVCVCYCLQIFIFRLQNASFLIQLFSVFFFFLFSRVQEINYDSPRGGVSVITEKGDITTSYLLIQRAKTSDSGKYTCSPSTANPITVNVHVLNGECSLFPPLFYCFLFELSKKREKKKTKHTKLNVCLPRDGFCLGNELNLYKSS